MPSATSRKATGGFGARIVSGALSGAAIGTPVGWLIVGGIAGILGAAIGTLGGYAALTSITCGDDASRPRRRAQSPSPLFTPSSAPPRQ